METIELSIPGLAVNLYTVALNLSGHEMFAATSIGIAISGSSYEQPDHLLRDADTAQKAYL